MNLDDFDDLDNFDDEDIEKFLNKGIFKMDGLMAGARIKAGAIGFVLGIVFCVGLFAWGYTADILNVSGIGKNGVTSEETKVTSVTIQAKISELSELSTAKYVYTNAVKEKNAKTIFGKKVPFTDNTIIVKYDGVLRAGVNLENTDVDVKGTTISITLPEAEIFSNEIDHNSFQYLEKKNNVFNPFDPEDVTDFEAEQKEAMINKAKDQGLLEEAEENAKKLITEMLTSIYSEEYKIEFK